MMKWAPRQTLRWSRADPYCAWAEATHWRGFRRLLGQRLGTGSEGIDRVRVLVQARTVNLAQEAMDWTDLWTVADLYRSPAIKARHFVAELSPEKLPVLRRLAGDDYRWELSIPFRDAETVARAEDIGAYGPTRASTSFRPAAQFKIRGKELMPGSIDEPLMAVIDFGCPFLNQAFDGPDGRARIAAIWDQGATWSPPLDATNKALPWPWADGRLRLGYGRTLGKPAMGFIRRQCKIEGIDESEAYRRIDYLISYDDARRRVWQATHGSHVTSVAAGWPDPLAPTDREPDVAAKAPIVFVQLPALTAADSGGGSLSAQVLDALRFVLDMAQPGQPVVVNLSYGSFAGPHDGSSLVEQAMDELVSLWSGSLAIVIGAGNGRLAGCHVARTIRPDRSALLRVRLEPGDFTDTYVETWFKPRQKGLERVTARVRTAAGDWSGWIGIGQCVDLRDANDKRPVARLSFQKQVPNGDGSLLLLALAPTERPADDDGPLATAGVWQIELALAADLSDTASDPALDFESWVERDDPGWLGQGAQARFDELRHGETVGTLNSLATGRHTIVVGGFRLSDGAPADYSATGLGSGAAFVYGACEESDDLPSILGAAVRTGDCMRMNGTSVASPVVARRLLNHVAGLGSPVPPNGWAAVVDCIIDDAFELAGRPAVLPDAMSTGKPGPRVVLRRANPESDN